MADKTIGSLDLAPVLTDGSSFVCEDGGVAKRVTGKQFKDFAKEGVEVYVTEAVDAADRAEQAAEESRAAADSVEDVSKDAAAAQAAAQAAENASAAAEASKQAAQSAAGAAAEQAAANVESALQGYVTEAQDAKAGAQSAAQAAANEAAAAVESELQDHVIAAETAEANAKAAQAAAEQARDDAQSIAGGDFASTTYVDGKASAAETNAKSYTDQKIAAIPAPDVSGQINAHNDDAEAHADIRQMVASACVQSDWNENDETSKAYVKNRPFYSEVELTPVTTYESGSPEVVNRVLTFTNGTIEIIDPSMFAIYRDTSYRVIWDDAVYDCKSIPTSGGYGAVGGEGYPFMLSIGEDAMTITARDVSGGLETGTTTHTLSVYKRSETVTKIPEKYLPDTVATHADIEAAIEAIPTPTTETWTFTLEDGSTVTKAVYVG